MADHRATLASAFLCLGFALATQPVSALQVASSDELSLVAGTAPCPNQCNAAAKWTVAGCATNPGHCFRNDIYNEFGSYAEWLNVPYDKDGAHDTIEVACACFQVHDERDCSDGIKARKWQGPRHSCHGKQWSTIAPEDRY